MANVNNYTVTAFNANGEKVHGEKCNTLARAKKTAREFLPYNNVFTVDVDKRNQLIPVVRFVKLTPNTGVSIANGVTANVRF